MAVPVIKTEQVEAIFFDMNGTLRKREPHQPTQDGARSRILSLLDLKTTPQGYWDELDRRYRAYSYWAQENLIQLPEEEIWADWILPDAPAKKVRTAAAELSLAWSERKGHRVPSDGATQMLVALKQGGYRLGVISNSMSSLDIPRSLKAWGWMELFETVLLSSEAKIRKPAPDIFLQAACRMGIEPFHCAYLGNRVSRDMLGCQRAGFALGILLESPEGPRKDEEDPASLPCLVIHSLGELPGYFPPRRMPVGGRNGGG